MLYIETLLAPRASLNDAMKELVSGLFAIQAPEGEYKKLIQGLIYALLGDDPFVEDTPASILRQVALIETSYAKDEPAVVDGIARVRAELAAYVAAAEILRERQSLDTLISNQATIIIQTLMSLNAVVRSVETDEAVLIGLDRKLTEYAPKMDTTPTEMSELFGRIVAEIELTMAHQPAVMTDLPFLRDRVETFARLAGRAADAERSPRA